MDERDSSSSREIVSGGNGPSDSNRSRFAGGVMVAALGWANTAIAQDISADPQGSGGRAPVAQLRAADGKCPGIATQGLAEYRPALIAL
jgi:hypothetical protein